MSGAISSVGLLLCVLGELIDYKQFCGARATDKVSVCSMSGASPGVGLLCVLGGAHWL